MFIFNTTFSVENSSIEDWKSWMNRNFLPTFVDLLPGLRIEIYKLLAVVEEGNTNFSCQIQCKTPEELEIINKYVRILLDNLKGKFGEKCLFFSSILQETSVD